MKNYLKSSYKHTNTVTKVIALTIMFFLLFYSADLFFDNFNARSPVIFQWPVVRRYENRLKVEPLKPTPTPTTKPKATKTPKVTLESFPKYLTNDGSANRDKALAYLSKYYSGDDLVAADNILKKEAGYRTDATNGNCGGIPQACPSTKMGCDLNDSGLECQLQWFVGYVNQRYGSPVEAWNYHLVNNWY